MKLRCPSATGLSSWKLPSEFLAVRYNTTRSAGIPEASLAALIGRCACPLSPKRHQGVVLLGEPAEGKGDAERLAVVGYHQHLGLGVGFFHRADDRLIDG